METMFLVVGLAVAGLAGIAAAFYFSIRSGNRDAGKPGNGQSHDQKHGLHPQCRASWTAFARLTRP